MDEIPKEERSRWRPRSNGGADDCPSASPWQPSLLSLVAACGEAGRRAGKPVGVCGEAAADPLLAPVLVGLGITSLSMAARAVPLVGATLARLSLGDCAELARLAVEADTAASARAAVHERVRG